MKNIKHYTDHLMESMESPKELGQRLLGILSGDKAPDIEEVRSLIQAGADLEAKDTDGWTALHHAAHWGHTEAVNALIGAGADLEAKDTDGNTSLHLAAALGHTEAVNALIQAGADLEAKNTSGWTALHCAAYWGHTEAAKALIGAGADLEARTLPDWTPLHCAAVRDRTEIAKALIQAGADIISAGFDSLDGLEEFFGGDISWIPQQSLPPEWRKRARSRGAFGRF